MMEKDTGGTGKKRRARRAKATSLVNASYDEVIKNHCFLGPQKVSRNKYYGMLIEMGRVFIEEFVKGRPIELPEKMGVIELCKYPFSPKIVNGELKLAKGNTDWEATHRYWAEVPMAQRKGMFIYADEDSVYRITYDTSNATYRNKRWYRFRPTTQFSAMTGRKIRAGELDAIMEGKNESVE